MIEAKKVKILSSIGAGVPYPPRFRERALPLDAELTLLFVIIPSPRLSDEVSSCRPSSHLASFVAAKYRHGRVSPWHVQERRGFHVCLQ